MISRCVVIAGSEFNFSLLRITMIFSCAVNSREKIMMGCQIGSEAPSRKFKRESSVFSSLWFKKIKYGITILAKLCCLYYNMVIPC